MIKFNCTWYSNLIFSLFLKKKINALCKVSFLFFFETCYCYLFRNETISRVRRRLFMEILWNINHNCQILNLFPFYEYFYITLTNVKLHKKRMNTIPSVKSILSNIHTKMNGVDAILSVLWWPEGRKI